MTLYTNEGIQPPTPAPNPQELLAAKSGGYRYGFNRQERENEITGSQTHYSAEFWMYDARLGRRWEIDPMTRLFPKISAYSCFFNSPIKFSDSRGLAPEGDPIRIQVKGTADNLALASTHRSTLPSVADDGQEIIFEYSHGRYDSRIWTYSKESGSWSSETVKEVGAGFYHRESETSDYRGHGNWSMTTLSKFYGVDYTGDSPLLDATELISNKIDRANEITTPIGLVADITNMSAQETTKELAREAGITNVVTNKTLANIAKSANTVSSVITIVEASNHLAKATNNFAKGNSAEGWKEIRKTGTVLAGAVMSAVAYGAIGGPVGVFVAVGVSVLWTIIND